MYGGVDYGKMHAMDISVSIDPFSKIVSCCSVETLSLIWY